MNDKVREALDRMVMFASLSEAGPSSAEVGATAATIRAHIEGLEAKERESFQLYVDANEARIDAEARVRELEEKAGRVTAAFKAHGRADGVVVTDRTRKECEASMLALNAALPYMPEGEQR